MRLLTNIVLAVLLTRCGANHSSSNNADSSIQSSPVSTEAADENTITDQPNDFFVGAKLVDAKANMPDCSKGNYQSLIYVADSKEFFYCNSNNSWTGVDIQGPAGVAGKDGKDGTQGVQGIAGAAGRDGRDGVNGQNGINGDNGSDIATEANQWMHPVTGKIFVVGAPIKDTAITSATVFCASGTRFATDSEAMDAYHAGIAYKFASYADNATSFLLIALIDTGTQLNERIIVTTSPAYITEAFNHPTYTYRPLCVVE